MKTITAKELRDNLGAIAKRVQMGEEIKVTYREKPAFILKSTVDKPQKSSRSPLSGLAAFDKAPKKPPTFSSDKSTKELYREHLEEKYGR